MPTDYGDPSTIYYKTADGELVQFTGIQTISAVTPENEDDICPYVHWPEQEVITLNINMKRSDHRKMMKMLHSWKMHEMRRIRNYKRVKEQSRRAVLKWNALHQNEPIPTRKEHIIE